MVEFEADDALAAAAAKAALDPRVDRVIVCTPDKDLAQSVRIAQMANGRRRTIRDEAGVIFFVRRAAGVDLRLPGARWRRRGRLSGPSRLGRKDPPRRCSPISPISSRSLEDWRIWGVDATRPGALVAHLAPRVRACLAVSRSRDTPEPTCPCSNPSTNSTERPDACLRAACRGESATRGFLKTTRLSPIRRSSLSTRVETEWTMARRVAVPAVVVVSGVDWTGNDPATSTGCRRFLNATLRRSVRLEPGTIDAC